MLVFRQLFDQESGTYTYFLADTGTREAVLIDPVRDQAASYRRLLSEMDMQLVKAIDTHVHADHITALGLLRDETGCETWMGEQSSAACVSRRFADGEQLGFGPYALEVLYTPGHTDDSYCFLLRLPEQTLLFSGDTLLIRGTGRTDFQNGSASAQYHSLFGRLLKLPDDTVVYPGHDYKGWTQSTIGEERYCNPRLQVVDEAAYVTLMENLKLPNPKMMDIAVPANQSCGKG